MKRIIFLIVFSLAMCNFAFAQSPLAELEKIKEIKFLKTTREDAAKIFADYFLSLSDDSRHYQWFSTKNANIQVSYSSGRCSETREDWNVPEWKVTEVEISFENSIAPKDIGVELSKYKKEKVYANLAYAYVYHSKDLGIAFKVYKNKIDRIVFTPSKENYSLLCDNERIKNYYSSKSWFYDKLKERIYIREHPNGFADVVNLNLSLTEITASCNGEGSNQNCTNEVKQIFVSAFGKDPENDVLIYDYQISGGKIIGKGANVVWDLSGVKPGTYTIKAAVDDGCGLCGESITKTITVKECPNCLLK